MKGSRVDQFTVGQRVQYSTDIGHKIFRNETDDKGAPVKVFDHNVHINRDDFGRICKLHMSGRQGVAEIMPEGGGKKLSRKLQNVVAA